MAFWKRIRLTLDMIKFEHSVFALPFALTGAFLAVREHHPGRSEVLGKLLWIVVAMVATRSAAMAFNRILDAKIDALNPRTRMRHIPAGILTTDEPGNYSLSAICSCGSIETQLQNIGSSLRQTIPPYW